MDKKIGPIDIYTSTGVKFWQHYEQMVAFKKGETYTVVSTHISPEGRCNLNCRYCAVKRRKKEERIDPGVIKQYISDLIARGLKAVIFTGGGEPTLYPYFDEIVYFIASTKRLKIGLITNGTLLDRLDTLHYFDWIRVSINKFKEWGQRINVPEDKVNRHCTIGASIIYSGANKQITREQLIDFADKIGAEYIRIIPDCLHSHEELLKEHDEVERFVKEINDRRFFHQFKIPRASTVEECHQSFFRPYLSEVGGGTVYPCDSIVLNDSVGYFQEKYQLCKAGEVLDYIDKKIKPEFSSIVDCPGCVFTENNNLLENFKKNPTFFFFDNHSQPIKHEEFI